MSIGEKQTILLKRKREKKMVRTSLRRDYLLNDGIEGIRRRGRKYRINILMEDKS